MRGERPPHNPPRRNIKIKAKNAKDKELTEEEKASSSVKAFGFPIKDFGNDGGGVIPECLYEESKLLKGKNMDFHLLVTPATFEPFLVCP